MHKIKLNCTKESFFIILKAFISITLLILIFTVSSKDTTKSCDRGLNKSQPHTEQLFHKTVDVVIIKAEYQALGQWLYITMNYEDIEDRVQVNPYEIHKFQDLLYDSGFNDFNGVSKETPLKYKATLYTRTTWDKLVLSRWLEYK